MGSRNEDIGGRKGGSKAASEKGRGTEGEKDKGIKE
jgi:hypothetical protein